MTVGKQLVVKFSFCDKNFENQNFSIIECPDGTGAEMALVQTHLQETIEHLIVSAENWIVVFWYTCHDWYSQILI